MIMRLQVQLLRPSGCGPLRQLDRKRQHRVSEHNARVLHRKVSNREQATTLADGAFMHHDASPLLCVECMAPLGGGGRGG